MIPASDIFRGRIFPAEGFAPATAYVRRHRATAPNKPRPASSIAEDSGSGTGLTRFGIYELVATDVFAAHS